MADTNPPGTIRVTVGQRQPSVTAVSYGLRTLKGASDLSLVGAVNNYAIVYKSATDSFVVQDINTNITDIDNGFF